MQSINIQPISKNIIANKARQTFEKTSKGISEFDMNSETVDSIIGEINDVSTNLENIDSAAFRKILNISDKTIQIETVEDKAFYMMTFINDLMKESKNLQSFEKNIFDFYIGVYGVFQKEDTTDIGVEKFIDESMSASALGQLKIYLRNSRDYLINKYNLEPNLRGFRYKKRVTQIFDNVIEQNKDGSINKSNIGFNHVQLLQHDQENIVEYLSTLKNLVDDLYISVAKKDKLLEISHVLKQNFGLEINFSDDTLKNDKHAKDEELTMQKFSDFMTYFLIKWHESINSYQFTETNGISLLAYQLNESIADKYKSIVEKTKNQDENGLRLSDKIKKIVMDLTMTVLSKSEGRIPKKNMEFLLKSMVS